MDHSYALIGLSGSLRKGSTNTKLVKEAARAFGQASFTMGSIRLPLYDGDIEAEAGVPAEVTALAEAIAAADGVIISTPEYNKNLSGALKNAFDWLSRTKIAPFKGKPIVILSASAGRSGGERAQYSLRHCLNPFQPRLISGPEVFIAASAKAFGEDGHLVDEKSFEFLGVLMQGLKSEIDLVRTAA